VAVQGEPDGHFSHIDRPRPVGSATLPQLFRVGALEPANNHRLVGMIANVSVCETAERQLDAIVARRRNDRR
jgi:hypothetical protein